MSVRIQVVIDEREREAFRARAGAEGLSLSEWLREAGRERMARGQPGELRTAQDLREFFDACEAREVGTEPDWEEHLEIMRGSRTAGLPQP